MTKPFSPREVAYRVKAQLRRAEYRNTPIQNESVKIGALTIDTQGCRVTKGEKEIELTAREFEILDYMAENIGCVISRERLYRDCYCKTDCSASWWKYQRQEQSGHRNRIYPYS